MAKPLISYLLLKNSNSFILATLDNAGKEAGLTWNKSILQILQETPRVVKDIQLQANAITQLGKTNLLTRWQLFRKVIKGWDKKDYDLVQANHRIKQLEARVEQLEPRKRRRVRTSPNSKFVDIQAIKEAQIEAGDREIEEEDSDLSMESTSTGDYIEVQE